MLVVGTDGSKELMGPVCFCQGIQVGEGWPWGSLARAQGARSRGSVTFQVRVVKETASCSLFAYIQGDVNRVMEKQN